MERQAQACALRDAVFELAADLRVPIVLHFMEGMPQTEVGKIMGINQSQVSRRIAQALGILRERLTSAGASFSIAALPGMFQDIPDFQIPSGMGKRIMDRLLQPAHVSRGIAIRQPVAWRSLWTWAAACTLATAAGGWWLLARHEPVRTAERPNTTLPAKPSPPESGRKLFFKRWTFENGVPHDIAVVSGKWTIAENADDGTRTLAVAPGETLLLRLPVSDPAAPHRIEIEMNFLPSEGASNLKVLKLAGNDTLPMRLWRDRDAGLDGQRRRAHLLRSTFDGRYDVTVINGLLASVAELEAGPAPNALAIEATGAVILSVEYHELDPEALPDDWPDPRKGIAELKARGMVAREFPSRRLANP